MSRLGALFKDSGQSPWIDNIRRDWLEDGTLEKLVASGVRGVTSNPSIFAKAFATTDAYDRAVAEMGSRDPEQVFEDLAVCDVQDACDLLAGVHSASVAEFDADRRRYCDGFVSIEVSPRLAHDTNGTIAAARKLWSAVNRKNAMIKIPATLEGLPAITSALADGINVNVTLIFSVDRYEAVLDAWLEGLRQRAAAGENLSSVSSVASFFVSRVDSAVDALLAENSPLRGRIAQAQVASAYQSYLSKMQSPEVAELLERGAQVQRPLWASTSTKDPTYDKLLYVDFLVANETVNTMPDATLELASTHSDPSRSLLEDDSVRHTTAGLLVTLPEAINLKSVTANLEREGVAAFINSYSELLATVKAKLED
jgi:transaldolase